MMTTSPAINSVGAVRSTTTDGPAAVDDPGFKRWEGRLFGGLVLAAFLLYGIGSALVDDPLGVGLVAVNSVAVAIVGIIGFRLLRNHSPRVGAGYLVTRLAEAILLVGGVALYTYADRSDADTQGYLLGMLVLGIGSVPFWYVVGRGPWLSTRFALWGVAGYVALAAGALMELTTGREVTYFFAAPGGLFEVAVGLHLLRRGFGISTHRRSDDPRSPTESPTEKARPSTLHQTFALLEQRLTRSQRPPARRYISQRHLDGPLRSPAPATSCSSCLASSRTSSSGKASS